MFLFLSLRCVLNVMFSFHSPAYEDGTDSEFRNVGNQNSDAGELPKNENVTNTVLFSVTLGTEYDEYDMGK